MPTPHPRASGGAAIAPAAGASSSPAARQKKKNPIDGYILTVSIIGHTTINPGSSHPFMQYEIEVRTLDGEIWSVWHRYTDFRELRDGVSAAVYRMPASARRGLPRPTVPAMDRKRVLHQLIGGMSGAEIETRVQNLNIFLRGCVNDSLLVSLQEFKGFIDPERHGGGESSVLEPLDSDEDDEGGEDEADVRKSPLAAAAAAAAGSTRLAKRDTVRYSSRIAAKEEINVSAPHACPALPCIALPCVLWFSSLFFSPHSPCALPAARCPAHARSRAPASRLLRARWRLQRRRWC